MDSSLTFKEVYWAIIRTNLFSVDTVCVIVEEGGGLERESFVNILAQTRTQLASFAEKFILILVFLWPTYLSGRFETVSVGRVSTLHCIYGCFTTGAVIPSHQNGSISMF